MRQVLAFVVGGTLGFVVDAAVLVACMRVLDAPPLLARVPSFLVAATVTWRFHRRYTFPAAQEVAGSAREWLRFLAANAAGNLVNLATYALMLHPFGLPPLASLAIASLVAAAVNFFASKRWVFRG